MPTRRIFPVLLVLCLSRASPLLAAECTDYAQVPVPLGSITFDSPVRDVDVGPGFACVVAWDRLFVVDITKAANPTQLAALDLSDSGKCITISGSLAFVGESTSVTIVDIGVPSAPVVLGRIDTKDWILGIEVRSPFLYVVGEKSSFLIIDISDPSKPIQVASTSLGYGFYKGIALHGEIAYVASDGLYAVDVRDPLTPTILGSKDLDASDVFIAGGYAYVSTRHSGMAVVDIGDPARPVVLGAVGTPGDALALEVADGMAYMVDVSTYPAFPSALRAIDVSNPALPRLVGSVDLPGLSVGFDVSGNLAYILSGRTLHVVDTRDLVSTAVLAQMDTPGTAEAAAASGDFVYVADYGRGVHVIDSRDPQMPRIVGSVDTPGSAQDIVVSGTHAYVADGEPGLQVLDIHTPSAPTLIATLDTPTAAARLTLEGHYVYVSDLEELLVIDIATPSSPVLIGSLEMHVTSLDVEGDYAFAGIGSRLHMIRITDPFAPRSVTYMPLSWLVDDIQVTNGVEYVANGLGGFLIVDVQNPFAPVVIGGFDWDRNQTSVGGVQVEGAHAYLTDGSGLHVLDISRPASPVLLGSFALDQPRDLLLHAGQVYIPGANSGLFVLRPQCRPTAVTLEDFRLERDGESVVARWRCSSVPAPAFHLVASAGSDSWDVPIESGSAGAWEARDRSPHLLRLDAADYRLFAREPGEDWVVLAQERISLSAFTEHRTLLSAYPNPFAGNGRIRYEVGAPQQLRVSVHDVHGRLVRRLLDGLVDTSRGEIAWDGLDTNGRTVAAGVYVVRLESPSAERSLKLVMTR